MGTLDRKESYTIPPTQAFSHTVTPKAGYILTHIHVIDKNGVQEDIAIPPGQELGFTILLNYTPVKIIVCEAIAAFRTLHGHYRGDFFPIFNMAEKISRLDSVARVLGSINNILGYRYSNILNGGSDRALWTARPLRTATELLADIAAGPSTYAFYAVIDSYSDVSISEGTITITYPSAFAVSPYPIVAGFSGISQDMVIGFDRKDLEVDTIALSSEIASAEYRIRTSKATDWNSIAFKAYSTANKATINADIQAVSGEWEMQLWVNYNGSNSSGIVTTNFIDL